MTDEEKILREETLRQEIANDFEHNYFIEAGAGAGKTSLVVDRITNQLSSGLYKPEEIAAITFTNKAAQELRERISGNLNKHVQKDADNKEIKEALQNIGRMQISTIHSFCHRILKENCFSAGLRPDFELLEEEDAVEMKEKFFRNWFNKNAVCYTELKGKSSDKITYKDLQKNFCDVCDLPDNVNFCYEDYSGDKYDRFDEDHKTSLTDIPILKEQAVNKYKRVIEEELGNDDAGSGLGSGSLGCSFESAKVQDYLKKAFKTDDKDTADKDNTAATDKFYNEIVKKSRGIEGGRFPFDGKKGTKDIKARLKDIGNIAYESIVPMIDEIAEIEEKLKSESKAVNNYLVLDLILRARSEYKNQKTNHYVTNDMLLQKTNNLLNDSKVVRKLRNTFKCIYLDESQDTDPIQNELIMKIGRNEDGLIPGMLFIVGDVKQSIYRFREADYRLFINTREIFRKNSDTCRVERLDINNRSNKDLVDYFNERTGALSEELMPGYENMVARQGYRDDSVLHGAYVYGQPENDQQEDKKKSSNKEEPDKLVKLIEQLVEKGKLYCQQDGDSYTGARPEAAREVSSTAAIPETAKKDSSTNSRPVEYRDILVLTRNSKSMGIYVDAFHKNGIPVRISVNYLPGEMKPLRRFGVIYRYLAIPTYRKAMEGIAGIVRNDVGPEFDENLAAKLKSLRVEVSGYNGAELIGWLLEHSELYLYDGDTQDGNMIKHYQMAVRQMADQVLSKCGNNALAVSRGIEDYLNDENGCDREIGYDMNENAVRFMNIHKAKGLEGNIVIIADRKEKKEGKSTYTEGNNRYQTVSTSVPQGSDKVYTAYELNEEIKERALLEDRMENARLEYVAVTRAKEALIFMQGKNKNAMFVDYVTEDMRRICEEVTETEVVGSSSNEVTETEVVGSQSNKVTETNSIDSDVCDSSILHAKKPDKSIFVKKEYRISPSTMELARERHNEEKPDDDYTLKSEIQIQLETNELLQTRPSGDLFGTVMHRVFELAVHEIRNNTERWQLCIDRAINENNDDMEQRFAADADAERERYREFLQQKLPEFVDSLGEEIRNADEVYTEFPFSLTIQGEQLEDLKQEIVITDRIAGMLPADGEDQTVWINGKADLILRKNGVTTVWDYKSDKDVDMEELHKRYDNQMNLYKWVMRKCFGGEVKGEFYSV